jgi:predicted Kef-type K+ transport protein
VATVTPESICFHILHRISAGSLGVALAGFIIGPHTPPLSLIHDEDTIKTLAELGVILLPFLIAAYRSRHCRCCWQRWE